MAKNSNKVNALELGRSSIMMVSIKLS